MQTNSMTSRLIAFVSWACVFTTSATAFAQESTAVDDEAKRPSKPNIIIMMADDMGIGDTSAYLGVRLSPSAAPIE